MKEHRPCRELSFLGAALHPLPLHLPVLSLGIPDTICQQLIVWEERKRVYSGIFGYSQSMPVGERLVIHLRLTQSQSKQDLP